MIPITLSNQISIPIEGFPLAPYIRQEMTFRNARYEREVKRRPDTTLRPRFEAWRESDGRLYLNRGAMGWLIRKMQAHRLHYEIEDRTEGAVCPMVFTGNLNGQQVNALRDLTAHRFCQLAGPVGSGKMLTAVAWMGEIRLRTLVVVQTRLQLHRWHRMCAEHLDMDPDRIGRIGDGKHEYDRDVMIAIHRSLERHLAEPEFVQRVGALVIDRVDRSYISMFERLNPLRPHAVLGLTSAPARSDGLSGYIETFVGPCSARLTAPIKQGQGERISVHVTTTGWSYDYADDYGDMITALCSDYRRNRRIADDILAATADPDIRAVVISERLDHLNELAVMMDQRIFGMITGETPESRRKEMLNRYRHGKLQMIFTTNYSLEAVEVHRADVVVIASPIKYDQTMSQILIRLVGITAGKGAKIYDYRDEPGPLKGSLANRMKHYRLMNALIKNQ